MRIEIDTSSLDRTITSLDRIKDRLERPHDLMEAIAIVMRRSFAENFNAGGRPTPWAPLALRTLLEKMLLFGAGLIRGRNRGVRARLGPGQVQAGNLPGILIRTGRLKDAAARRGVQGNIHRLSSDGRRLEIGVGPIFVPTENPYGKGRTRGRARVSGRMINYGAFHQEGVPSRHLPRRAFIVVQEDDLRQIESLAEAWLQGEDVKARITGRE